ncbi:MAG: DNA repair protein RecO [Clostridia bacterium]|nr:DNA repair protein RecO [Clostridia bacterium]
MTDFRVNGLVIRETEHKDNDKLLTVLTEKYGKLYVIGKGVKSLKNRHMASSQLFAYSSLNLRKTGNNLYYITDSDLIENYYEIRNDILKLSLATFVCDVLCEVSREGTEDISILRLALNTFYAIAKDIKSLEFIRASFELRILTECGFMPDLSHCRDCGCELPSIATLDIMNGNFVCNKCMEKISFTNAENTFFDTGMQRPVSIISDSVLQAMRYVCTSRQERFLSFRLDESEQEMFFQVCEKYLLNQLERGFYSLEFYKSMI